jgi:glycerol-3-phosphate dehydrogenase
MDRDVMLGMIKDPLEQWDFIIVGGGATGLGVAIEASARGYRTVLVEQSDFAKGTSSRSTKLIHGGVRYLRQGRLSLVLGALRERESLARNAPHLVHELPFVVPSYAWWEASYYGFGLWLYDRLARSKSFGSSKRLSREETLRRLPTLETVGLRGGVLYFDAQFDDARLAINMAQTAVELGGTLVNYVRVVNLLKANGRVSGVVVSDVETGEKFEIRAKLVINATGPFADLLRRMDDPEARSMISPSQGVHIVLPRDFLPGDTALMIPRTDDKRILFAIPWNDRVLVGTTDMPIDNAQLEPRPFAEELDFLLSHAARYLTKAPTASNVLSAFAGIRPLVGATPDTASTSRDHTLEIADSSLITITGGKWTTYRKMGEDTVDQAAQQAGLDQRPSITRNLKLHGYDQNPQKQGDLAAYGADAVPVRDLLMTAGRQELLHPRLPVRAGEVVWAARKEMARSVEDFLARRSRCLLLDARASMEAAPKVAKIMTHELGRNEDWEREQIRAYRELAQGYLPE